MTNERLILQTFDCIFRAVSNSQNIISSESLHCDSFRQHALRRDWKQEWNLLHKVRLIQYSASTYTVFRYKLLQEVILLFVQEAMYLLFMALLLPDC